MIFCLICLIVLFVLTMTFGILYLRMRQQSDILAGLVLEVTGRSSVCDELPESACVFLPTYCYFEDKTCKPR
jgi:hypothetical protein